MGLGLIGAGAAVFAIILSICFYQVQCGREEYCDHVISGNLELRAYRNGVRIWNKVEERYTTKKIRWVSESPCKDDSLVVFCDKEGRRGYYNFKTGEIVIPAQYSKAWNFSEGLAAVLGGNNCIGFINKDNNLVIDYIIPYENGRDYIFRDGYCTGTRCVDGVSNCALYRKDGSLALDWSYKRIDEPYKGYRIVGNKEGLWLLDGNLNRVFLGVFDAISFAEGNEGVYVTKNHVKQLLSYDGTVLEPFVVDSSRRLQYEDMDETGEYTIQKLDDDVVVYLVDCWEGLIDARTGSIITPACYWNIEMASKDLLIAKLGYNEEAVVIDKNGRIKKIVK